MGREENEIVSAAMDYLKSCEKRYPCLFWRQNQIARKKGATPIKMPKGSLKGVPDILGAFHRIPVGLECKTQTGELSPSQKSFRGRFQEAGGAYFIIRSLEDVQAAIRGLKKRAAEVSKTY